MNCQPFGKVVNGRFGRRIGGDFSNTVRLQLEQQQGTDGHSVSTIDEFKVNSCDNIIWNGAGGWGYVGNV